MPAHDVILELEAKLLAVWGSAITDEIANLPAPDFALRSLTGKRCDKAAFLRIIVGEDTP